MLNRVVQLSREKLVSCMTCPLCDKVFKDATTIAECLHTFCRKCIYDKLSDEDMEQCPICNTNLGPTPLEKLRPDHNWQDLRAKVFPRKKRSDVKKREDSSSGMVPPEVYSSGALQPEVSSLPPKRKERSLSSLAFDTPKVSNQATVTGKRTKNFTRKAAVVQGSSITIEKPIKIEEDHLNNSGSPENSIKFLNNSSQSCSSGEPSQSPENKEQENGAEQCEAKGDLWKPLNYLVEAASRSKSLRSSSQGFDTKPEARPGNDSEVQGSVSKSKVSRRRIKFGNEKINADRSTYTARSNKSRRNPPKKESVAEASISPQAIMYSASGKNDRRESPVWFSLLASENQAGEAPLPQISARYLRIMDGSAYVSYIQKYLKTKLELANEEEVEIRCMGQPVDPALKLHKIVDLWLQSAHRSQRIAVKIGSPAEDYLVVLRYARKVVHC